MYRFNSSENGCTAEVHGPDQIQKELRRCFVQWVLYNGIFKKGVNYGAV